MIIINYLFDSLKCKLKLTFHSISPMEKIYAGVENSENTCLILITNPFDTYSKRYKVNLRRIINF